MPYPVHVPVDRPYPVKVLVPEPYPVEKPVAVPVQVPVSFVKRQIRGKKRLKIFMTGTLSS